MKIWAIICACVGIGTLCSACEQPNESSRIEENVYYTVTFRQDGYEDIVKPVEAGKSLVDIPATQYVKGHTTVWSWTDFTALTESITVTAVSTANTYTVTFDGAGETVVRTQVRFGEPFVFPVVDRGEEYRLLYWKDKKTDIKVEAGVYAWDEDKTFVAVWDTAWSPAV